MLDVLIIGGGISGCSMLYQLSKYKLNIALLEKENDVGVGTTKANSAIVHAGYDPEPNTLMAKYNVAGNALIEKLCQKLDVLYKKCGSLVVAFSEDERAMIETLYARGIKNGVPDLRIVEKEELFTMEPNLATNAVCALLAPSGAIVNPWELAVAQAEVAVEAGAKVYLNQEVIDIQKTEDYFTVTTKTDIFSTRFVVNAAGIYADAIGNMVAPNEFTIRPNRGEYYLLDTTQGNLVNHVIFQCPSAVGKGVLVTPTVHGNLMVGPSSEPLKEISTATTKRGQEDVRTTSLRSVPFINFKETVRTFSGIRAASTQYDFIVGESPATPGFFNIAGIKSPGLTAAPAIAVDMVQLLETAGLSLEENPLFKEERNVTRFKSLSTEEKAKAIEKNPLYGNIVCRCETITEGEIVDALHRPLAPTSIDGIKRRCTPGMGRCQGGFCAPRVQSIIARELDLPIQDIPLDRVGMNIIVGETKQGEQIHE